MLPSLNRLRKTRDINLVYKRGVYGGAGDLSVKAVARANRETRLVVVVSKKISKRAVTRNLIRRRLIGAVREMWATVPPGYDIVVSVHADLSKRSFTELMELLDTALRRARVLS